MAAKEAEETTYGVRRILGGLGSQRPDCVAGHIGLELANVALTQRDLHRSLLGVREKSLIRKCSVNPRSSPEITKNRHFRVRVLHGQPRSQVSTRQYTNAASPPRSLGLLAFRETA